MKQMVKPRLFYIFLAMIMIVFFACASAEEWVLADDESIVVKVQGFEEDSMWGHTMKGYLENKTDKLLMYSIENCAINGVMNDPFWATEVMAIYSCSASPSRASGSVL